jgi:hypothetical protein
MFTTGDYISELAGCFSETLRLLLEERNLYQTVQVELKAFQKRILEADFLVEETQDRKSGALVFLAGGVPGNRETFSYNQLKFLEAARKHLSELTPKIGGRMALKFWDQPPPTYQDRYLPETAKFSLDVELPVICIPCHSCSRFEPAHTPFANLPGASIPPVRYEFSKSGEKVEVWTLAYQCQACRTEPLILTVRRDGFKFQLVGKSHVDSVEAPPAIPKSLRRLWSDAIIARKVGKLVGAAAYLRLFIESHVRAATSNQVPPRPTCDALMAAYSPLLNDSHPQEEGLRSAYGLLSEIIHGSDRKPATMDKALALVKRHFEVLSVHPLKPFDPLRVNFEI